MEGRWRDIGNNEVGLGWDPNNLDFDIGHELDLVVDYKPNKYLRVRPAYSVFVPTGAGKALTGPDAQHFVYIWLIAKMQATWKPAAPRLN